MATAASGILATLESQVEAVAGTEQGVALLGTLAALLAPYEQRFVSDFQTAGLNLFATLENGVLGIEESLSLRAKAVDAKLFGNVVALLKSKSPTVPPAA